MAVLIDKSTRLLVQGLTGREGTFHTKQAAAYGTTVVGGVRAGKGGTTHEGWPIFDTVADAVRTTGANASVIFVPPSSAADAVTEAVDAGLGLVVCITEGIPTLDMLRVRTFMQGRTTRLVGPNCPGVISPGKAKAGIIPGHICKEGRVGIVSRIGDAHLRGHPAADRARPRTDDVHRHRRRPDHRDHLRRRAPAVRPGRRDRGGRAHRRDWRHGRGRGGRVHPGVVPQARRELHCRTDCAARPADGPRRRHHRRREGDCGREDGGAHRAPESRSCEVPPRSARRSPPGSSFLDTGSRRSPGGARGVSRPLSSLPAGPAAVDPGMLYSKHSRSV